MPVYNVFYIAPLYYKTSIYSSAQWKRNGELSEGTDLFSKLRICIQDPTKLHSG
jgi:hypothetical protein